MADTDILFEEKQYLGHNRFSMLIRTALTLFCFVGYYWSENPKPVNVAFLKIGSYPMQDLSNSGKAFFIMGLSILVFSAALMYVLHMHLRVSRDTLELQGFWTSRVIKIKINNIKSLRKRRYKRSLFRRASYNLHNTGVIRFYTSGEDFVEITDRQGFVYRIGSQRIEQLYEVLKKQLKSTD